MTLDLAAVCALTFLIGAMPFAHWVSFVVTLGHRLKDPRIPALARVLTDICKGALAVRIGYEMGLAGAQLATLFVYLGHIFPYFKRISPRRAGFGPQKGTGTLLGALAVLDPVIGLTALSSWMFAYYVFRHATYSAVISACLTTLIWCFPQTVTPVRIELLLLLTALVVWRHRYHVPVRV